MDQITETMNQLEPSKQKFISSQPMGTGKPTFEVIRKIGRKDLAEVFVARFRDGRLCEFVDAVDPRYKKEEKWIINLSTQFGCPVGCPYCDAGGGYKGEIKSHDMLNMAGWVINRNPPDLVESCRKLKIHFSRMGEPSLNDEVLKAIPALRRHLSNTNVWICVATVAPRGRDRWFEELLSIKEEFFETRFQLQFSINSTQAETRRHLVPIPHLSLQEIAEYGERFHLKKDRKVALNFALAKGNEFDEKILIKTFNPDCFCIKLTPVNPTLTGKKNGVETVLRSYRDKKLEDSLEHLRHNGFDVILSIGDAGEDEIGSNCGQAVRFLSDKIS